MEKETIRICKRGYMISVFMFEMINKFYFNVRGGL